MSVFDMLKIQQQATRLAAIKADGYTVLKEVRVSDWNVDISMANEAGEVQTLTFRGKDIPVEAVVKGIITALGKE